MRSQRANLEVHAESSLGLSLADRSLTIGHALQWSAERYGDRRAMTFEGRDWTYAQLWDDVCTYAAALIDQGVGKGSRVALMMGTRPEFVLLLYATAVVGGVSVLVSTYSTPAEALWILGHSDAALFVAHTGIRGRSARAELGAEVPALASGRDPLGEPSLPYLRQVLWCPNGPEDRHELSSIWNDFLIGAERGAVEFVDARLSQVVPDDDALLLYTSGSTAAPKAVLHVHRAPTIQGLRMADCMAIGPDDVTWTSFPTFWSAGLVTALFAPFAVGACSVLQESFDPQEALHLIERERVTSVRQMAHDELRLVAEHVRLRADLSSIDVGVITPALRDLTGMDAEVTEICGWGMTETFTQFTMLPFDADIEARRQTNGEQQPGNVLRIVDPETGDELGRGEVGEITVAGPVLFRGYYKQSPLLPLDAAGCFHTGDTGYVDAQSRLVYTGRLDRLIKSGGVNVSPIEVEERLLGWGRVGPCSLLGVVHPTLGQAAVLGVVRLEGEDVTAGDVIDFLRRELSSYKLPRHVLFFSAEEMPLTASSKVVVSELRVEIIRRLRDEDIDPAWKDLLARTSEVD